ncbi:MAG: hypothetical protein WD830_04380 [Chloroflexota bacterium]
MATIRRPAAMFAAAIGLTLALVSPAAANHSWGGYHWARTSNPFTVSLGDNVSGLWDSMLRTAASDWTQSTVLNSPVVAGSTKAKACRPTAGRVEVCSARYGNNGWLGLAQIWITGGEHIVQGIVKNNDYYFGSSSYQYNNTAEMQHVICQEIGHTFGLGHTSEDGSSQNTCMDYYHNTSASDTQSTHPNAGDYDQLRCIYDPAAAGQTLNSGGHSCTGTGHLDSTNTTGSAAGKSPAGGQGNDASSWGRLVSSSASGREQTFRLNLGRGEAVVTFVIWAN